MDQDQAEEQYSRQCFHSGILVYCCRASLRYSRWRRTVWYVPKPTGSSLFWKSNCKCVQAIRVRNARTLRRTSIKLQLTRLGMPHLVRLGSCRFMGSFR